MELLSSFHSELLIAYISITMLMLGAVAYFSNTRILAKLRLRRVMSVGLFGLVLIFVPPLYNLLKLDLKGPLQNYTELFLASVSVSQYIGVGLILLAFVHILVKSIPQFIDFNRSTRTNNSQLKKQLRKLQRDHDETISDIESLKKELDVLYENHYKREISGSQSIDSYRKIFDLSPLFYFELSDENEINDVNRYACKALNYSFGELVSSRFLDIVVPAERTTIENTLRTLRHSPIADSSFETKFKDRNRNPISVNVTLQIIPRGAKIATYLFCQDVSESRELSDVLAFQATHDDLTELYNRRALEAYFDEKIALTEENQDIALIYFDVDQLKVVNDTCGHTAGDQLLKQLVAVLKQVCEPHVDIFSRIGGDEFAIIKSHCDLESATVLAEELRNAAEDFTFSWEGKSFRQSISVGVAVSKRIDAGLNDLLSSADAACYMAKESGRNQVRVNDVSSVNTMFDHRQGMLWVSRLDKAIKNGDFLLNFQPIVQLDSPYSSYIHYEVLIQYVDENGKRVPPGNFLPSAERFGKSTDIDLWVMTETFDFLRRNPEHTRQLTCCSINLTSHSIANHRSRGAILALMKTNSFPASKICFEITETSAISNLSEAIEFIQTLKSLGCRFALDDFGTGFSSFGYLKNLDVDYLKIDGSFVRDIVDDKVDKAMIRAISEIAQEMGIETVAEYVENEKIVRELKKVGVDMGQGYGIAKPMPLDALHEFYHSNRHSMLN